MSKTPATASDLVDAENLAYRPRVKVCGITRPEEAELAVSLGADLVGLNFYPPSPRYLDRVLAAEVAAASNGATRVGVFVNAGRSAMEETAEAIGLDLLQLHGDEEEAEVRALGRRAIKALRVTGDLPQDAFEPFPEAWGFLVDSRHPQLYGGTGEGWRFASLDRQMAVAERRAQRVMVAGGLGPHNLRHTLNEVRPWGVDLCSGVESEPGRMDPDLLKRLFEEIHHVASPS